MASQPARAPGQPPAGSCPDFIDFWGTQYRHAIREFKPNRSTHSIPCKCACAAWVPMRAARATDLARATPRPSGGDGDGPLADGRTPVECRAHCASSTGRQRCLARVEPVGRGGTNGGGAAILTVQFPSRAIGVLHSPCGRGGRPCSPPTGVLMLLW